ncbi:MAG: leucyl aminopeptidase family protein, partial [Pseudomonadota bacterium]
MSPSFAPSDSVAIPLHVVEQDALSDWLSSRAPEERTWIESSGFNAALGQCVLIPGPDGAPVAALAGYGTKAARLRGRFHLAGVAAQLPKGIYKLDGLAADRAEEEALGWLLSAYRFDRYKEQKRSDAALVAPECVDATRLETIAAAECLTRDLINTPAADMGPAALESAALSLAEQHGAQIRVVRGAALLEANFPMIHTVGRAAA